MRRSVRLALSLWVLVAAVAGAVISPVQAQTSRFILRAEPEIIPANGISTSSIFVQVPSEGRSAISAAPLVRFATTSGVIESTAQLQSGVARVLLRSSTAPGTAVITAFVGSSRETVTVEFTSESLVEERFLEVAGPYVAYGTDVNVITASGRSVLGFGDLRIESSTRLDVDLQSEHVWAEGDVLIRNRRGKQVSELRGDRLYYDLRRRRGVMRRGDTTAGVARQEFVGADFIAPSGPDNEAAEQSSRESPRLMEPKTPAIVPAPEPALAIPPQPGEASLITPADEPKAIEPVGETAPTETPETEQGEAAKPEELTETRATALVALPRQENGAEGGAAAPHAPPPFSQIPAGSDDSKHLVVEVPPPHFTVEAGYWVTGRSVRVFPRERVQFERAAIFFNGGKVFRAPLYVMPLDGSFNPTTDTLSFNSEGGLGLKFPFYYQASRGATGALYLRHEPGDGFSTGKPGFSLGLEHQYHFSSKSNGKVSVDQIGRGGWNLNMRHEMRLSPTLRSNIYVNSPRHRDLFASANLTKELRGMQIGLESFFDKQEDEDSNLRGQFFVRMRPKAIGKGWRYDVSARAIGVSRYKQTITEMTGGGVGLPGRPTTRTITRSLFGQNLTANLQSPTMSPWRGAAFSTNLFTSAFTYSDGRSGIAPGLSANFTQSFGEKVSAHLDYTYDRSAIGLYGATTSSYTHYVSGGVNVQFSKKLGLNTFVSKSLSDGSLYGSADLDYLVSEKWRVGLFTDFQNFDSDKLFNYGWSLGRRIGQREISINYDANRSKVYFELGGLMRY